MFCSHCGGPLARDDHFCPVCGQPVPGETPPPARTARFAPPSADASQPAPGSSPAPTNNAPSPWTGDDPAMRRAIQVGDLTIAVEGDLVPVANVELGGGQGIYFEHHTLLWKEPRVAIQHRARKGMARRFFAGVAAFLSETHGPGNIAISRESVGQIVALPLSPGQSIDVREHQFLLATTSVEYGFASVSGVANALFTRTNNRAGLFVDRFTGQSEGGLLLLHGYGNVFEKQLGPGEVLDVEPGAWLWKEKDVRMTVTSLLGSGRGGLIGAFGNAMAGVSVTLNRFIGPGHIGIQSMTTVPAEQRQAVEQDTSHSYFAGSAPAEE